ncbi:uncharacterized protein LOC115232471 [Octopus sinensis]|uniref:Uncharacterized protein LOC115232471 n=1 Tax=Octopus sinensis TaxID=2607531 RepID=A0A6P7U2R1_9MOLL|nr:uncharacterized protein LOC115232471 [Octopus sinensis]
MKVQAIILFFFAIAYCYASVSDMVSMIPDGPAGSRLAKAKTGLQTAGMIIGEARAMWSRNTAEDIVKTKQIPYHCTLAASYSNLTSEVIRAMDQELQIMIAGTNKLMKKMRDNNKDGNITFNEYVATMTQNQFVTSDDTEDVVRSSSKSFGQFRLATNSIDQEIVDAVALWFANDLIKDADILAATRIDIVDFANIVGLTGATVDSLESLIVKNDYAERSVVDVGVIRYPDADHPYFKLFRIQLFAYRKSNRVLFVQKDASGIRGLYQSKVFRPNPTILGKLRADVRERAMKAAQDMFAPESFF